MRAYATAMQAPSGPVFSPSRSMTGTSRLEGTAVVRTVSHRIAPNPAQLMEFAEILSAAKAPALIFGAAIDRGNGWDDAIALAEKMGATVYAAPASERAPFLETHPLYAGGLPFAKGPLSERLKEHDVAIVIGAPVFRYYPWVPGGYLPEGLHLLHISDDPAETARARVGDSLVGDAVLATQALFHLVHAPEAPATVSAVTPAPHHLAPQPAHPPHSDAGGLPSAADVFAALAEVRPEHALLVEESPSNLADLHRAWPVTEPSGFFNSAAGGLGLCMPASVGIALGERDTGRNRPVLMVVGDGLF